MGGEQAAGVLFTVKQEQLRKQGQTLMTEEEERDFKQPTLDKYEPRPLREQMMGGRDVDG